MKVIADVTARVGGALAGVLLGLVLAGALSQFLNLSCQLAPAVKSDHCGMLVWLVFAPLAACTGAFFGGMRGLSIESRRELDEWERAIGRVGLGLLCGVVIFLVLAVMSYEPAAETGRLGEARYLRPDLIVAAVNSIPALGLFGAASRLRTPIVVKSLESVGADGAAWQAAASSRNAAPQRRSSAHPETQ